jgi:signal transduction histidine kinase
MSSAPWQRRPLLSEDAPPAVGSTGLASFTQLDALLDQLEWRQSERRGRSDRRVGTDGAEAAPDGEQVLAAIRELCHDMRQSLAAIAALTAGLHAEPRLHPHDRLRLAQVAQETRRLSELVAAFLARPRAEPVDLSELVREAAASRSVTFLGRLELDVEDGVHARGDSVLLYRAISNVLDNACRVVGPEGRVLVCVAREAGGARIDICDDGPGMGASQDAGLGLGITIVQGVMERHHGQLQFAPSHLGGTRVRLLVPDVDAASTTLRGQS